MAAHSYWRINVTATDGGANVALAELTMSETAGGADACSGGTPFVNNDYLPPAGGENGVAAFDNNYATRWATDNTTGIIGYHFASPVDIQQITIQAMRAVDGPANDSPNTFSLEYSDNGTSYSVAKTFTGSTGWASEEIRTFNLTLHASIVGAGGALAGGEATIGSHNVKYTVVGTGGAVAGGSATIDYHNVKYSVIGSGGAVAGGQGTFGNSDPQYDYITGFLTTSPAATVSGLITPPGYVFDTLEMTGELTTPVSAVAGEMNLYLLSGAVTTQESTVSGTIRLEYNLSGAVSSFVSNVSGSMLRGNALSGDLDTPVARVAGSLGMGAVISAGALKQHVSIVSGTISDRAVSATPEGICLVINTTNLARSEYTNFIPDSIIEFGGSYYGAFPDGIYLLEGADDAGTTIVTEMQTGQNNLVNDSESYATDLYVAGTYTSLSVTAIADKDLELPPLYATSEGDRERRRITLSRGVASHYWGFKVRGMTDLDSLEVAATPSSRKVSRR